MKLKDRGTNWGQNVASFFEVFLFFRINLNFSKKKTKIKKNEKAISSQESKTIKFNCSINFKLTSKLMLNFFLFQKFRKLKYGIYDQNQSFIAQLVVGK